MSSHYPRFTSGILLSLCIFFITTMTILFSPVTFAASYTPRNSSFQEDIERASVSVVRLVANYTPTSGSSLAPGEKSSMPLTHSAALFSPDLSSGNTVTCTGLGFIIASWGNAPSTAPTPAPTSASTPRATATSTTTTLGDNTWIMTDGTLVNNNGPTASSCSSLQGKATLTLSSIKMILSSKYNSTPISKAISNATILCSSSNSSTCNNGPVLVGFSDSTLYPYLKIQLSSDSSSQLAGIALSNSFAAFNVPTVTANQNEQFITPYKVSFGSTISPQLTNAVSAQVGMPIVDSQGYLQGMYASEQKDAQSSTAVYNSSLQSLLQSNQIDPAAHQNPLADDWNNGITDYAQGPSFYAQAHKAFVDAFQQNSLFAGANMYAQLTASASGSGTGNTSSLPGTQPSGITLPFLGFIHFWLLILGSTCIIILLVLLIVLNRLFRHGQEESAVPNIKREVQPIHIGDAYQPQQVQPPQAVQSPPLAQQTEPQILQMPHLPQEMSPALQTTHNGMAGAAMPPAPPAPLAPVMPMPNGSVSAPYGRADIANQPTLVNFNQSTSTNGQGDTDATIPLGKLAQPAQTVQSTKELGFEVITNTDPGLKRMHKPNEDSLFAVHGVRDINGTLQQVGLFIVADGMGGHADGKVASTLAIQTIINHVLPRLMHHKEPLDNPAQLLAEGVQNANHAVHQHNTEHYGDMGTTVTSTMLIGTTAYVANVGDSRTYLYHHPDGLSKITRDHSVVASLVDAGIIKEEDIYTHTKRNQIYRSLGEKPYVEVDTFVAPLQPGDKLLLCSDGMWEMVRDPNIQRILEESASNPQELGNRLIQAALEGGGEDNVSIIVVNVLESPIYTMKVGLEPIYKQEEIQLPALG